MHSYSKHIFLLAALAVLVGTYFWVTRDRTLESYAFAPTATDLEPLAPISATVPGNPTDTAVREPQVVARNLDIPWELAFLPDGSMLVTERGGTLKHINSGVSTPVSGVSPVGEGGLLGLVLHPNFATNRYLYLYFTTRDSGSLENTVVRYTYEGNALREPKTILGGIIASRNHDGGRIAFGPDGYLYITVGDASKSTLAQDTKSLNGKILRLADDGSVPSDNPFGNAVYSYGHRNPQGLAWDADGNLWATEHGRSGLSSGYDEVNKIEKGGNYGWPNYEGDSSANGITPPVVHSGASATWAPSGIAFVRGHLVWAGLRGESLYVASVSNGQLDKPQTYLSKKYGRLRTVVVGPDGALYILTNNGDGRGTKRANDDQIIRVPLPF
jgi:glucose/arabinose dehydrogenase